MNGSKDFDLRFASAKKWRDAVESDIEEVYEFCAPERQDDFSTTPKNETEPDIETYISIGEEMATDLAGDLVNFFVPQESRWASYEVTQEIEDTIADQVLALVEAREDALFQIIESSNFNDVAPQIMFEPATHGTAAIWVDKGHLMQPLHIEVVPPNELYLVPGHQGHLDRFREKWVPGDTVKPLLGDDPTVKFPKSLESDMKKPDQKMKVTWGFWLDWSDPAIPYWCREIRVNDKVVSEKQKIGPIAGACPLLVGRFNPTPGRPWGRGPARKALRDLRTLNKIEEVVLSKLDEALNPAYSGVDDGLLDFSDGIQAGKFYPRRAGSDAPEPISAVTDLDYGFYSKDGLENRIRQAFYQDGPRQRGDTPPTATQWADERRRIQQRLGKPSAPLWTELILPMIQRIEYLGVQQGFLPEAITLNKQVINVRPMSPLQKAQNQDQVIISRGNLELAVNVLGEMVAQVIDPIETVKNIVNASGDKLTKVRDEMEQPPVEAAQPPA